MPRRISAFRGRSIRPRRCRKARSAITWAITACSTSFPYLRVERVTCRDEAIWPFTVVGRPPQEDTVFGQLIHELTAPVIPTVIPGVHAVHAVDAAGVHPLMLAIGSERYVPYEPEPPAAGAADTGQRHLGPRSDVVGQVLVDRRWAGRSAAGRGRRAGVLSARAGARGLAPRPALPDPHHDRHAGLLRHRAARRLESRHRGRGAADPDPADPGTAGAALAGGFHSPRVCLPGVLAVQGPAVPGAATRRWRVSAANRPGESPINQFPWLVIVDDSEFTARQLDNFLWVVFTRSDPAPDTDGIAAFVDQKHWGCRGALVTDARIKPQHAPPLIEDPAVSRRVDAHGRARQARWPSTCNLPLARHLWRCGAAARLG